MHIMLQSRPLRQYEVVRSVEVLRPQDAPEHTLLKLTPVVGVLRACVQTLFWAP